MLFYRRIAARLHCFDLRRRQAEIEVRGLGGRKLAISPQVYRQSRCIDWFEAREPFPVEIAIHSLIRSTATTDHVLEFVPPDFDRLLRCDRLVKYEGLFPLLAYRCPKILEQLIIKAQQSGQELWMDIRDFRVRVGVGSQVGLSGIDQETWSEVRGIFKALGGFAQTELPPELPRQQLRTDWDLVTWKSSVQSTVRYMERVHAREQDLKSTAQMMTHYHPVHVDEMRQNSRTALAERQRFYSGKLDFSFTDLQTAYVSKMPWFEIRSMGTPEHPLSRQRFTSRFYHTAEVVRASAGVIPLLRRLLDPGGSESPLALARLSSALRRWVAQMDAQGYSATALVMFQLQHGLQVSPAVRRRIDRVCQSYPRTRVRSEKDLIWYYLFNRDEASPMKCLPATLFSARRDSRVITWIRRFSRLCGQNHTPPQKLVLNDLLIGRQNEDGRHDLPRIEKIYISTDPDELWRVAEKCRGVVTEFRRWFK